MLEEEKQSLLTMQQRDKDRREDRCSGFTEWKRMRGMPEEKVMRKTRRWNGEREDEVE